MKKALFLIISTLIFLPAAYAIQHKLRVNFKSPLVGDLTPPIPAWERKSTADGLNHWSRKYGISEYAGPLGVWGYAPWGCPPLSVVQPKNMGKSVVPVITGIWLYDITSPEIAVSLQYLKPVFTPRYPISTGRSTMSTPEDATFTIHPEPKNDSIFLSFSQPVDKVLVQGAGGLYALEGFIKSPSLQSVPDSGSTLILLGIGLLGLAGVKMIRQRMLCQCAPLVLR